MVMENEIKKIYTALSGGKIVADDSTVISLKQFNSIAADRFIAELKKRGIYWDGSDCTFAALVSPAAVPLTTKKTDTKQPAVLPADGGTAIGIDIQAITELHETADYWEDAFYASKFKAEEIAYSISKDNPRETFAGIYACKEALIKCDNTLQWDALSISYGNNGIPLFENYAVSISHSGGFAIAVALKPVPAAFMKTETNSSKLLASPPVEDTPALQQVIGKPKPDYLLYIIVSVLLLYTIYKNFLSI